MTGLHAYLSEHVDILSSSEDRETWLQERRSGVSASDVAALFGASPFMSELELYAIKRGESEGPDLSDNEAVFWGNVLEDAIINGYSARTGRPVIPWGKLVRSKRFPWMLATPDAFTSDDDGATWWPLQIKNIGLRSASEWDDGVPRHYTLQCQHEAIVCGMGVCTAAALIAGQSLAWDDLEVSEVDQRRIVHEAQRFMDDVAAGRRPEPDGSDSAKRALQAMFADEDPEKTVVLPAEFADLDADLEAAKQAKRDSDKRVKELEQRLQAAIGEAGVGAIPGGATYRWKTVHVAEHVRKESTSRRLYRSAPKGD